MSSTKVQPILWRMTSPSLRTKRLVETPTLAVWSQAEANERHEGVLRAVRPAASYERLRLGDDPAPTLARLAQAVGAS